MKPLNNNVPLAMFKFSVAALDNVLAEQGCLLVRHFSLTDTIACVVTSVAQRCKYIADYRQLQTYLERQFQPKRWNFDHS